MKVNEEKIITDTVKEIYNNEQYPKTIEISYNGLISKKKKRCFANPPIYQPGTPYLIEIIEELTEVKGLENLDELFETYAKFAKELINKDISNVESIRRLLTEKLTELEEAYFMQTRPLMKFMTQEEIADKIYSIDPMRHDKLAAMLCFMNIFGFEKLLKEMEEVFEIFTSHKIGWKINADELAGVDEFDKEMLYPIDSKYLIRVISRSKALVLRYHDIEYKLRAIEGTLNRSIFDYTQTKFGSVSSEEIKRDVFKEELSSHIRKSDNALNVPSKNKLDDWIEQIAESISGNKKSDVEDPETIELYLKFLVNNPLCTVNKIKRGIQEEGNIPDCDTEKLEDFAFNTFRGWEKKFFEVLTNHCFNEYAQRFSRY